MAHPVLRQVSHMALRHESRTKGKGRTKHPSECVGVTGVWEEVRWVLHGNAVDT